ncbi:MAG TPA: cytochrome c maturation protein CcmE [Gammaproteobacteria bacterium]
MTPRQQRMAFVGVILGGVALATILALTAISENMMYFYSPSQIKSGEAPAGATIRVGGLVVDGSVARPGDGLTVAFDLTDTVERVSVRYTGILPDLFREGQGIVAIGKLNGEGVVMAEEVLAKHDENYMPPEVAEALKIAQEGGEVSLPFPHTPPGKE